MKYPKAVKGKNALLVEYGAKILKLKGCLLDKFEKLKMLDNYCFKQGQRASCLEQAMKKDEEKVSSLGDQMSSFFDL